jgi:hypothetical protein
MDLSQQKGTDKFKLLVQYGCCTWWFLVGYHYVILSVIGFADESPSTNLGFTNSVILRLMK